VKHNEMSKHLFLERMMTVAEQQLQCIKKEYCEDVEWRWGYEVTEVGSCENCR